MTKAFDSTRRIGAKTGWVTTLCWGAVLAIATIPNPVKAVGFRMPNQDPEGIARGNAFTATADNPSAIYYNPAGITQLKGDQVSVGMYLISADTEFTSSTTGAKANTDTKIQAVPQMHYTHEFKDTAFTAGLGVYAPYGLSLDWGDNSPLAPVTRNGKLLYATVNPVVAWHALPSLSFAIGPTINYSDAILENAAFKFHGSDVAFGYKAGVLWQPHRMWSFGVNFHSETDMDYSGHSSVPGFSLDRASTDAELHFPYFVTAGVSFRPTTNWNFEFDLDWTDWNSVDQVVFKRSDGVNVPFVFNYESGFMYCAGITRQLGKGYWASVGYIYAENSSPEFYYNPIVPDGNLHLGSAGFGQRGQKWDWALGSHFAYNPGREITSNVNPTTLGEYKTLNIAVNLSFTYKF